MAGGHVQKRQLHLRFARPVSDQEERSVRAAFRVWKASVDAVLANFCDLPMGRDHDRAPRYEIGEPSLDHARVVFTIPIDGEQTLGSRAAIENSMMSLLVRFLPFELRKGLEEGLTEETGPGGPTTNWRPASS